MQITYTLHEQFRAFCFNNRIDDASKVVEYFAVFGGTNYPIDTAQSIDELIHEKVLKNYKYIHAAITKFTQSDRTMHAILSAIAQGDGREHAAIKRARIPIKDAQKAIDILIAKDILRAKHTLVRPLNSDEPHSTRLEFTVPFLKFWFMAISPYYQSIKAGDFSQALNAWHAKQSEFFASMYESLARAVIPKVFAPKEIKKLGSYWDSMRTIDTVARTNEGEVIVGLCKLAKTKANMSVLTQLKAYTKAIDLSADYFVIFSKGGFASSFKKGIEVNTLLLTPKNFNVLIDNLTIDDAIVSSDKVY